MIKRAVVTVGLVGALGCAISAPAQAATPSRAVESGVAASTEQESSQQARFQGVIVAFKDDYLVLETDSGQVRFNLTYGAEYCGKMRVGVAAVVDAFAYNGEWAAQKIVTE